MNDKMMKKFAHCGTCLLYVYGAPHVIPVDWERLQLPGVILYLSFYRSPNHCASETFIDFDADAVESLHENVPVGGGGDAVIEKVSLFANKDVFSGSVKLSTERVLTKSCALFSYLESST